MSRLEEIQEEIAIQRQIKSDFNGVLRESKRNKQEAAKHLAFYMSASRDQFTKDAVIKHNLIKELQKCL